MAWWTEKDALKEQIRLLRKEIKAKDEQIAEMQLLIDKANEKLKVHFSEVVSVSSEEDDEPYFGWCDVKDCKNEGCGGGVGWRETGYWILCNYHAEQERKGLPQPEMKQSAIDRENSRDKITGYLRK